MTVDIIIAIIITFASQTWLQGLHVIRFRNNKEVLRGVSAYGIVSTAFSESLWIGYSVHHHLIGGLSNALLSITSAVVISLVVFRAGLVKSGQMGLFFVLLALWTALCIIIPVEIVALGTVVLATFFLVPQTIRTVRSIGTPAIDGMGNRAITMVIVANSAWIVYGVYYTAPAYYISSSIILTCGLIMAFSKIYHRKQYGGLVKA